MSRRRRRVKSSASNLKPASSATLAHGMSGAAAISDADDPNQPAEATTSAAARAPRKDTPSHASAVPVDPDSWSGIGRKRLTRELDALLENISGRRNILLHRGLRGLTRKKLLSVIAGVMALFSAGAIAAVIAKLLGDTVVQIVAAAVAGASGTISLVINAYYSDEDSVNSLTGASKYLALRQDLQAFLLRSDADRDELMSKLREYQSTYANLDTEYSRYMPTPKPSPHKGAAVQADSAEAESAPRRVRRMLPDADRIAPHSTWRL
jgi:hypothetical protein